MICWQFSVRIVEPITQCDSYTSSVMSFIKVAAHVTFVKKRTVSEREF